MPPSLSVSQLFLEVWQPPLWVIGTKKDFDSLGGRNWSDEDEEAGWEAVEGMEMILVMVEVMVVMEIEYIQYCAVENKNAPSPTLTGMDGRLELFQRSGSSYLYGFFDQEWKDGMTKDEAEKFVVKAVSLAIARDGASGGVVRTVIVSFTCS
ncbi:N-terminal nucleophile aminohydrolases (Ntn hydrolases) superfamily protein [Actinidia rufa]|uniref:N-terminal nucleophile aminohydrolases (Ntn hydrolases) superfamily protein n=1 Tax=Actinidia rufa TaxID=165716 RepID=A0A7J0GEM6_9ERIC|nr:N-terminal nucleophile aminohydrolases (Ntn hydrolases) superfamily protein [Actinidia rufa]